MILAWAVGLGLMSWRDAQKYHKPPVPGRLIGASLVFIALALLAEYEPARRAAVLAAWGFDLAVVFQIGPKQLTSTAGLGPVTPAKTGQLAPGSPGSKTSLTQHTTGG